MIKFFPNCRFAFIKILAAFVVATACFVASPAPAKAIVLYTQLYGQAYSPNIGWINFYCQNGYTKPDKSQTLPDFCQPGLDYKVKVYPSGNFEGFAYSPNYGWLDLNGVNLNKDFLLVTGVTSNDSVFLSSLGITPVPNYHFGTTTFGASGLIPGIYYDWDGISQFGTLNGFAYSTEVGWIVFAKPAGSPYGDTAYGVYNPESSAALLTPPPDLINSGTEIFAATDNKTLYLRFVDTPSAVNSLQVAGEGISVSCNITGGEGSSVISFECPAETFTRAQPYTLQYEVCIDDSEGNRNCENPSKNYQVVANIPDANKTELSYTTNKKIADGKDHQTITVILKDVYGNTVRTVKDGSGNSIKEVYSGIIFNNTTKLDQLNSSATEDSIFYSSGNESGAGQQLLENKTKTALLADDGNGEFKIYIKSYAPTSAGYPAIASENFDLKLVKIFFQVDKTIADPIDVGAIGETEFEISTEPKLEFVPALTARPQPLSFKSGFDDADPTAIENITLNVPKRYAINFANKSGEIISSPWIGLKLSTESPVVNWKNAYIEKLDSDLVDTVQLLDNEINVATLKNVSAITIGANQVQALHIVATPELDYNEYDKDFPEKIKGHLNTFVQYTIDGKDISHKADLDFAMKADLTLDLNLDGTLKTQSDSTEFYIHKPQFSVAGATSTTGTNDASLANTLGVNIKAFLANQTNSICTNNLTISGVDAASNNFTPNASCLNQNGQILYIKGADLTFDNGIGQSIGLPTTPRTIVVEGGDIYIKSNLYYPRTSGATASLGLVATTVNNKGGNIYIAPTVTNIVGMIYAEGALVSTNSVGKSNQATVGNCTTATDGISGNNGFCDRSTELNNQLLIKGILAANSSLGGSDELTAICKSDSINCTSAWLSKVDCSTGTPLCSTDCGGINTSETVCVPKCQPKLQAQCTDRDTARIYDLYYLRTFHENSGGQRAGYNPDDTDNLNLPNPIGGTDNNNATLIEYDSRIINNPPPLFYGTSGAQSTERSL